MSIRVLTITEEAGRHRLDRALAEAWPDLSRSRIQALMRDGHVGVDGAVASDPSARLRRGGEVTLQVPEPLDARPAPEPIPLDVVFEDDELVVIDKPAGLVVHPGAGHERGTLVNALIAHCGHSLSGIGGERRPGIVHRLDKDTSGLLVVAKSDAAHQALCAQFADHGREGCLERAYLALVWSAPDPRRGTVDLPLIRSSSHREKMSVAAPGHGRRALTRFVVEETYPAGATEPAASLVRCTLETGRTHQIRVHLAHLRHPLIGDALYGAGFMTKIARLPRPAATLAAAIGRQALHAALLQFAHPATGKVMRFESGLPKDLATLRASLLS